MNYELITYAVISILVFALAMKVLQIFSRADIFGKAVMAFAGVVVAFLLIAYFWEQIFPWLVVGGGLILLAVLGLVVYRNR